MAWRWIILIAMTLVGTYSVVGQDSLGGTQKTHQVAKKLEKSLEAGNAKEIAENYLALAKELIKKQDYSRAESYLKNALELYTKEKNTAKTAEVARLLAQVQEAQHKYAEAAQHYNLAGQVSTGNDSKINFNDAARVQNQANPGKQLEYIDSNLQFLEKEGNTVEQVQAYQNRARFNLQQDDKSGALADYSKAIEIAQEQQPTEVIQLKSEVADIYESDNQLEKAIEIRESVIKEAQAMQNVTEEIQQKKQLATLYDKNQQDDKAQQLLEEAFQTALMNHQTLEAKQALMILQNFYDKNNLAYKKDSINQVFFEAFDTMILSDSSLVDMRYFASTEQRIKQLEEQQRLKDELLVKTNRFNYVLLGSLVLLTLLLGGIIKSLWDIKKKNKKIALQSLRREMNPHFLFNSLNSINQFIAQNNELAANKYLTSYSQLLRKMMESSNQDFIPLSYEMELIKKYLELEHLRFPEKFDYNLWVDPSIDPDSVLVPNMVIQPNMENAIWHGLRYKDEKGALDIHFSRKGKNIEILIQDTGIGLKKSRQLKTTNQKLHQSRGLSNVEERIRLLNEIYGKNIRFSISENETGTCVRIEIEGT
jgi:two-component system sensor histidine kinase YesM